MPSKTSTELKALWINGFVPDQDDYIDLFDTLDEKENTSVFETRAERRARIINTVLANKFEYPTPVNTVVVNNLSELQAQKSAPNGTEIQLAAGLIIDVSGGSAVRIEFDNEIYLTSQDKNNKGTILLGENGSFIQFNGDDSRAYDFIYRGTWTHATRPIDPAPETVGIEVNGNRFKAYKLDGSGFSYATISLKSSLGSHVESCMLYDVRATGLGYCIVLNGETTLTAFDNYYDNYRHTIAKASDWTGQGYYDYRSYIGKGGVIASYAYDSHGEPDVSHPSGTNEYAGSFMGIIDCFFETHSELCAVSRGFQRKEFVFSGNTFPKGSRMTAVRHTIQGVVIPPNDEINSFDIGDNIYVGEQEDSDITASDDVAIVNDEGLFNLNLFNKKLEKITSNFAADHVFRGDFIGTDEYLTINKKVVQIFKKGESIKDFTVSSDFKGAIIGRIFQTNKDEIIIFSDSEILSLNFSSGSIVETSLISGIDIKYVLAGNFKNTATEKDLIVIDNSNEHFIYENLGSSFDVAESLGVQVNFDKGTVIDLYGNGTDDVIYYQESSKTGYRARFLGGVYRETPSISFTLPPDTKDEEFFTKEINGKDRVFVWGQGGTLRVYREGASGFTNLQVLNVAYSGKSKKITP